MQAQSMFCEEIDHMENAELIGVLTAISIISKRLIRKLTLLEEAGGDGDV